MLFVYLFKRLYLFIFRGEGGGEREGEKHPCVFASHVPTTGDLAHNLGMCPDWESNRQPFGLQLTLSPLSYTSQGLIMLSSNYLLFKVLFKTLAL